MSKNLKKTVGITALVLSTSLCSISANATEMYAEAEEWNSVNGLQFRGDCYPHQNTEFDVCDPEVAKKLKEELKGKPNFGKNNNSILTRFWDDSSNAWMYVAVNKKNNKVHPFFMGIRNDLYLYPELKNEKAVKLRFVNNERICTSGIGVAFEGDGSIMSRTDQYKTADFCTLYDEEEGFTGVNLYDSKTNKMIIDNSDIE